MKHPAGLVERVVLVTAVAVDGELNAAAALVEGVAGQPDDVEGIHHRGRVRDLLGRGGLCRASRYLAGPLSQS